MTHIEAINAVLIRRGYPLEAISQYTRDCTRAGTLPEGHDQQIPAGQEEEVIAQYEKDFERAWTDTMGGDSRTN